LEVSPLSLSPSCLACMFCGHVSNETQDIHKEIILCVHSCIVYRIFCCNGNIEDSERKKMLKHKQHLEHFCYLQLFSCCKMLDFLAHKWWSECL
jgi:hypothetical protein